MRSFLAALTWLCVQTLLMLFAPLQQIFAEESVDFRIHVENQTRARDDMSRKQLRVYQLYSRTSGKHVQVLGRRISARGEDGDKYARCGNGHFWESSANQGQGDRILPVHEPEGQAGGQAQRQKQGVRVCGEAPGEQLHGAHLGQVLGLVRGLHQEGAPAQRPADPGEPAGRALHEALPQGRAPRPPETLPLHHRQQAD